MPTNLFSAGDTCQPENSNVLLALIRRFHEAAEEKVAHVTCSGTASPLREFLHVDNIGKSCVFALK
jgi:GDP-L-fucose synthase